MTVAAHVSSSGLDARIATPRYYTLEHTSIAGDQDTLRKLQTTRHALIQTATFCVRSRHPYMATTGHVERTSHRNNEPREHDASARAPPLGGGSITWQPMVPWSRPDRREALNSANFHTAASISSFLLVPTPAWGHPPPSGSQTRRYVVTL